MKDKYTHIPPFATYPGGKNGDGVYQTIINHIPRHWHYFEPFTGGGFIYLRKSLAYMSWLNDIDPDIYEAWARTEGINTRSPWLAKNYPMRS